VPICRAVRAWRADRPEDVLGAPVRDAALTEILAQMHEPD
jgi:hypothetical protein